MNKKLNIIIYKGKIEVKLEENTLWLTQKEIANLFDVNIPAINKHIKNIYDEKELNSAATISKMEIVQTEGGRAIRRLVDFYNLDVIISVGYRVNSQKATQFRIWATSVLKKHLVNGYTINEQRLKAAQEKYKELQNAIALFSKNIAQSADASQEAKGIVKVLESYSKGLEVLDGYDHQSLEIPKGNKEKYKFTYDKAQKVINAMKSDFTSALFGQEREKGFYSILRDIYQTFSGKEVYPTAQEKAAYLLYFTVKNHCFTDGNKRIAAAMFVVYLDSNKILFNKNKERIIDNNSLAALTLMIAESNPKEKDMVIKIILNLLKDNR
ncbi:MAG: virulence RhuM family protein [Endomicrobia bacterium]|nr:virulence RhuM family protein [Endomicrobiia bacterium]